MMAFVFGYFGGPSRLGLSRLLYDARSLLLNEGASCDASLLSCGELPRRVDKGAGSPCIQGSQKGSATKGASKHKAPRIL